jgi:hypothetical protein
MSQDVVHWMDPKWITTFLSKAQVDAQTIDCVITALVKYNTAVYNAGEKFQADLEKCKNKLLTKRKPPTKK